MTDEIPITDEDLREYQGLCDAVKDRVWGVNTHEKYHEDGEVKWQLHFVSEWKNGDGSCTDVFEDPDLEVCAFVVQSQRLAPHFLAYIDALKRRCEELFKENQELKIERNQEESGTEVGALRNEVEILKKRSEWLEYRLHTAKSNLAHMAESI